MGSGLLGLEGEPAQGWSVRKKLIEVWGGGKVGAEADLRIEMEIQTQFLP